MYNDKKTMDLMKEDVLSLKSGSLRFWGEWFGRPMDNYHVITNAQFNPEDDTLILMFNNGESLTVWNPVNIKSDPGEFYIRSATKVKWEWFSYGQSQILQNHYYNQYEKQGNSVVITSGKGRSDFVSKKVIEAKGQHAVEIC